tara:strand:- start:8 stop:277 length:270 start_codon:yes stop_codon:yes gene_type:complete
MSRFRATAEGNVTFTAEEEAAFDAWEAGSDDRKGEDVRRERNDLLRATDWMSGSDVTMPDAWKTYRQALRDVPSQGGFPKSVTWPTKPS